MYKISANAQSLQSSMLVPVCKLQRQAYVQWISYEYGEFKCKLYNTEEQSLKIKDFSRTESQG